MAGLLDRGVKATGLVVAGGNEDGLRVGVVNKVEHSLEGLVVLEDFVDLSGGVVVVAGVIDPAALNHDEEALVTLFSRLLKGAQSRLSHLAKRREDVVMVSAINLKGNIGGREKAEHGELDFLATLEGIKASTVIGVSPVVLLLSNLGNVDIIGAAASLGGIGKEMASTTAKHQVDSASQDSFSNLLESNGVLEGTVQRMASKAGGGGVGDISGDDETGDVACPLGSLEDGATRLMAVQDSNGAVVALLGARKGGCASSTIGDQLAGGAGAAGAPEVLVENECVVDWETLDVLAEAACHGERGWAHAIGDHEDEVALGIGSYWFLPGLVVVLDPNGEDDHEGSGHKSPDEESEFSDSRGARGLLIGAVMVAIRRGQEGTLFRRHGFQTDDQRELKAKGEFGG